jgi:hypothetical protein
MEHIVWCADPACDASEKLEVAVVDALMVNVRPKVVIAGNEFRFEWDGRTWYVEDLWAEEKMLRVRTFAAGYYEKREFDDRVFEEGSLKAGKDRFYRITSEHIKALRVNSDELELEPYKAGPMWYMDGLPGIKIEDGSKVKPGALETGLNNVTYDLELEPGSYVKVLDTSVGKKNFDLLIGPVCRTVPRHSRVRSMVRFALGKQGISNLDSEAADTLVRPWLVPVSIAEVARTCGPNSGTLVKRWDDTTTLADVERDLGTSDVRAETADGEVVVYGDLRLTFTDGRLSGWERRGSS